MNSISINRLSEKKFESQGMSGLAQIQLEGSKNGKTIIKNLLVKPPLLVQKAMYLDPLDPRAAHIYLMSSAGGILQGDSLTIDIKATQNSISHFTTQAATKIYKAENLIAFQKINILVEKESYLEFLPKQIIPHKLSKFYQEVNLRIDQNSTLIYSENISCGRIAHGEKFDFNSLIFRTNAINENGKILFSDAMNIEPQNKKDKFENLFGQKNIFSTIYIVSKKIDSENLDSKIFSLINGNQLTAGVSKLPNNSGLVMRMLSDSIEEIEKTTSAVTKVVRTTKPQNIELRN